MRRADWQAGRNQVGRLDVGPGSGWCAADPSHHQKRPGLGHAQGLDAMAFSSLSRVVDITYVAT